MIEKQWPTMRRTLTCCEAKKAVFRHQYHVGQRRDDGAEADGSGLHHGGDGDRQVTHRRDEGAADVPRRPADRRIAVGRHNVLEVALRR